jgi:hypothetical protein
MKNQIQFIVDEVGRPVERPLVILMTSTHPMTDANLTKTGHQFFNLDIKQFPIKWEPGRPVPENMTIITDPSELPHRPDLILSQNIMDQYPIWQQLAYQFDCPVVEFEHTLPSPEWEAAGILDKIKADIRVPAYVFITEYSRDAWKHEDDPYAHVQYHMVDSDFYDGWVGGNGMAAIMCNAFQGREWAVGDILSLLMKAEDNKIQLFGHNPGFESPVLTSPTMVVNTLREFDVFINTSICSPIPASVLEAASIGMPIISTKTCAIPKFFVEGESIRYYETEEECLAILDELLADKEQRARLGAAARQVILNNFNEERYKADWNEVFQAALARYHG